MRGAAFISLCYGRAMSNAEFSEVTRRVQEVVGKSDLAEQVTGISVAETTDESGSEFLRVVLSLRSLKKLDFDRIEVFVRAIEDSVAEVDDRFASVRLAEAA